MLTTNPKRKLVDQTIMHSDSPPVQGNCMQAAVATLLGLDLEQVPAFQLQPSVYETWMEFEEFFTSKGYDVIMKPGNFVPDALHLASGKTVRGTRHMVVRQGIHLFHDPHPSRSGLLDVDQVRILVPLDPSHFTYNGVPT